MKRFAVVFAALVFAVGAVGCGSTSSAEKSDRGEERSRRKSSKEESTPIPAGSPFAKIEEGMRRAQVYDLIGRPTSTRTFPSGKAFIPYYYGPDTTRTGAFYKGLGRIVFSGADKVVKIEYDPTEDGY